MSERSVVITVMDNGAVSCEFKGSHITKREFDRVVKVLTRKYSEGIRLFRQSRKVEEHGSKRIGESGTETGTTSGQAGAVTGSISSSGIAQAAKPTVAISAGTISVQARAKAN